MESNMNMLSISAKKFPDEENSLFALIIKMQVSAIRDQQKSHFPARCKILTNSLSVNDHLDILIRVVWLSYQLSFVLHHGPGRCSQKRAVTRDVQLTSRKLYIIHDQNVRNFATLYFWPGQKFDTIFMTVKADTFKW